MRYPLALALLFFTSTAHAAPLPETPDAICGEIEYFHGESPLFSIKDGELVTHQTMDASSTFRYPDGSEYECGGYPNPSKPKKSCPPVEWTCPMPNHKDIAIKRKADFLATHGQELTKGQ